MVQDSWIRTVGNTGHTEGRCDTTDEGKGMEEDDKRSTGDGSRLYTGR